MGCVHQVQLDQSIGGTQGPPGIARRSVALLRLPRTPLLTLRASVPMALVTLQANIFALAGAAGSRGSRNRCGGEGVIAGVEQDGPVGQIEVAAAVGFEVFDGLGPGAV